MLSENIYLHETTQIVFFLRMFQDKCNRDCNIERNEKVRVD